MSSKLRWYYDKGKEKGKLDNHSMHTESGKSTHLHIGIRFFQ